MFSFLLLPSLLLPPPPLLPSVEQVKKFHAHDCELTPEKLKTLIEMFLRGTTCIEEMWLNNNCLGDEGVCLLADAIKTSTHLKNLYLSNNKITSDGCMGFAEVFKMNHDLRRLSLCQNPLTEGGPDGFQAIMDALEENEHFNLTHLYLSNCKLGDVQVRALVAMIDTHMPKLEHLEMNHNSFTDPVAVSLLKIVEERRKARGKFCCLIDQGNPKVSKNILEKFGDRNGEFWPSDSEDEDDSAMLTSRTNAEMNSGGAIETVS